MAIAIPDTNAPATMASTKVVPDCNSLELLIEFIFYSTLITRPINLEAVIFPEVLLEPLPDNLAQDFNLRDNGINMKASARPAAGFTLVELLVTVAISGGLALAIMSILIGTTTFSQTARLQAELTKDLQTFYYALEQYLGQTTEVISCNCAAPGVGIGGFTAQTCFPVGVDKSATAGFDAASGPVFSFVYEDAADPISPTPAGSSCLFGAVVGGLIPGTNIPAVGCKRILTLVYNPPTLETAGPPAAISLPGTLKLKDQAGTVLAQLSSVTSFACGMSVNTFPFSATLSNSDLRVRIDVKAKQNTIDNFKDGNYESWNPLGVNFARGYHRSHLGQITFRNLAMPGIHFGKIRQYKDCFADGRALPAGTDYHVCCSGYSNAAGTACVAATACGWNNGAVPAQPCCSRMTDSVSGACL
jgi:prepilin-type N-terminal cleavage/methylation domain-containing protein